MTSTTRRTFVGAAAAISAAAVLPAFALAQDEATPDASAEAASSLLTGLGLPEFALTVTDDGMAFAAEAAAGTVLLNASNSSGDLASILFVQLAEGITDADIQAAIQPDSGIPEWLHECEVTGGADLEPGQSALVGFTLTPGDWYVVNAGDAPSFAALTVTGEVAEVTIDTGVIVTINHHRFEIPAQVEAGHQIWQVANEETVLHHLILFTYPDALNEDQFLELLMASEGGATPAAGLDPALMGYVGNTGLLSQGQSNWVEFDLAPGNYQAACFISDPGSELPHAAGGMVAVFTVA